MHPLPVIILLAVGCVSGTARAEFMLQATPSTPPPGTIGRTASTNHPQVLSERTRSVVASGFGHAVPLRFAVRQLLPTNWHVRYGRDVDPDRLVSWEGGRPWDYVLRDAVKPLGLRAFAAPGDPYVVQIVR